MPQDKKISVLDFEDYRLKKLYQKRIVMMLAESHEEGYHTFDVLSALSVASCLTQEALKLTREFRNNKRF